MPPQNRLKHPHRGETEPVSTQPRLDADSATMNANRRFVRAIPVQATRSESRSIQDRPLAQISAKVSGKPNMSNAETRANVGLATLFGY